MIFDFKQPQMQEAVVPDVAKEQAIEHLEETHTNKEELIEQVEENSGYLHAVLMEQGQQNLDLEINKSECLFKVGNCEDLHLLEQIPTLELDSSSSSENPRAENFVEPEQEVIMLAYPLTEKDLISKPILQQVQEIVTEDTTLRQSSSEETREEAVESSRTRIIQTPLAQNEPAQINDLEDPLPMYDEYIDSYWYDIEVALNSPC